MSRQFRHRTVGAALVALFAAASLLDSGSAFADTGRSGRQIVFTDGATTGFTCESQPDVTAVTVPAESTIQVVNATGRGAELLLDGRSQGAIGENGSTEVVFRRGTVAMALHPDCIWADESTPVLVTASPTASPSPTGPVQSPTPSASSSTTSKPTPTSTKPTPPSATVSVGPPRRPPTSPAAELPTRPTRRPPTAGPSRSVRRPTPTVDPVPTRSAARRTDPPRRRTEPADRVTTTPPAVAAATSGAATSGAPAGEDARPLPEAPTTEVPSPTATAPEPTVAAAEPMAELEPMRRSGGIGLLALMAAVCVTGVMAGAIRTIAAQRASRANLA